jgi:hypothetical protein
MASSSAASATTSVIPQKLVAQTVAMQ